MATIKAHTDLEQARTLLKILPHKSADMSFNAERDYEVVLYPYMISNWIGVPCWSLAALLNYLRMIDFFPDIEADEHSITMNVNYYNEEEARPLAPVHNIEAKADTFVDACYEIILKLNELKML